MRHPRGSWLFRALLVAGLVSVAWRPLSALVDIPVRNWRVPRATLSPTTPLGDVSGALPFVAVTPCRIVDTRNAPGPYGGPKFTGGATRSFNIPAGPCTAIPVGAAAFSLNFTVTQTDGDGFLSTYPTGSAPPLVSTLNYAAGQTLANAAIVPAGTGGSIDVVAGVSGTHVIIDINGYFSPSLNATRQLAVSGSVAGGGVVVGTNTATSTDSSGVLGVTAGGATVYGVHGKSSAAGFRTAGVRGVAPAGSDSYGVLGEISGTLGYPMGNWGVVGQGTQGGTYGGVTLGNSDAGRYGVKGQLRIAFGTTPGTGNFGVFGTIDTATYGAGVVGLAYPAMTGNPNGWGVVGGGPSGGVHGVLNSGTNGRAVYGALYNGAVYSSAGTLGYKNGATLYGVFAEGDMGATGVKPFVEPHPTDAEKVVRYVALEGPEAGTYFRGSGRTHDGIAVLDVPESFRIVTAEEGLTVQLTPIGELATLAVVSQDLRQIVVRSSKDVAFHFHVNGVRRAFRDFQAITDGTEFQPTSEKSRLPDSLPEESRRRLVANGTYNEDGTVNLRTAERLGWTRVWEARKKATAATPEGPK